MKLVQPDLLTAPRAPSLGESRSIAERTNIAARTSAAFDGPSLKPREASLMQSVCAHAAQLNLETKLSQFAASRHGLDKETPRMTELLQRWINDSVRSAKVGAAPGSDGITNSLASLSDRLAFETALRQELRTSCASALSDLARNNPTLKLPHVKVAIGQCLDGALDRAYPTLNRNETTSHTPHSTPRGRLLSPGTGDSVLLRTSPSVSSATPSILHGRILSRVPHESVSQT